LGHNLTYEKKMKNKQSATQQTDTSDTISSNTNELRLNHARRLEAIGTLAGGIAHDLNNILTPILINAEVALLDLPKNHSVRYNIEQIISATKRARDLVKQIRTFSKLRTLKKDPLMISPIAKETIKFIKGTLPSTIQISSYVNPEVGYVFAAPEHIHLMLMNLLSNAASAMDQQTGKLDIQIWGEEMNEQSLSQFNIHKPGYYIHILIKDTGHGMDDMVKERIFDPFFTTKEWRETTGMGLSVVYGIVTGYGGDILVQSAPGHGSIFQIILPGIKYDGQNEDENLVDFKPKHGNAKILFIDDDSIIAEVVPYSLTHLGYQVVVETEPKKALALFTKDPYQFDIVMTDQIMPQFTGLEIAEKIHQLRHDIPIIICTGYQKQDVNIEHVPFIKAIINKPFEIKKLIQTIDQVISNPK